MIITNATHLEKQDREDRESTDFIMVHRTLWCDDSEQWAKYNLEPDAEGVRDFYALDMASEQKPSMAFPYTIVIGPGGLAEQVYLINSKTPHAYKRNKIAIGVAVIWDPREQDMPTHQWDRLVDVCADLQQLWPDARLVSHDSVPGASKYDSKVCPGIDMAVLCDEVDQIIDDQAARRMVSHGWQF